MSHIQSPGPFGAAQAPEHGPVQASEAGCTLVNSPDARNAQLCPAATTGWSVLPSSTLQLAMQLPWTEPPRPAVQSFHPSQPWCCATKNLPGQSLECHGVVSSCFVLSERRATVRVCRSSENMAAPASQVHSRFRPV